MILVWLNKIKFFFKRNNFSSYLLNKGSNCPIEWFCLFKDFKCQHTPYYSLNFFNKKLIKFKFPIRLLFSFMLYVIQCYAGHYWFRRFPPTTIGNTLINNNGTFYLFRPNSLEKYLRLFDIDSRSFNYPGPL